MTRGLPVNIGAEARTANGSHAPVPRNNSLVLSHFASLCERWPSLSIYTQISQSAAAAAFPIPGTHILYATCFSLYKFHGCAAPSERQWHRLRVYGYVIIIVGAAATVTVAFASCLCNLMSWRNGKKIFASFGLIWRIVWSALDAVGWIVIKITFDIIVVGRALHLIHTYGVYGTQ